VTEKSIRQQVVGHLKAVPGLWFTSVVGTPYGQRGVPDILGCYKGFFFGMEIKKPGGKLTPLQQHAAKLIMEAGGVWACVSSAKEAREEIKLWEDENA